MAEWLLSFKEVAELADLLEAVSKQALLGHLWCRDADYWAEQVRPELDVDDAETVGGLLDEVAGSPWLPGPMQQQARAWAATLQELVGGPAAAVADLDIRIFGG